MAPRSTKPKSDDSDLLKPRLENSKIEKAKTAPKTKADKVTRPKAEKGEKKSNKEDKSKDLKVEKVKAVTGDEAMTVILEYLKTQNRPYSATEVSANLHGKVTKTVADKLLKEMEQNQQIMAKATNGDKKGSQWVFWTLQDPVDFVSPEELAIMDETIAVLRSSIPELKTTLKHATIKLNSLKSAHTTSELRHIVDGLRTENAIKGEKLEGFKDGTIKQVSKEEMERVEKEWRYWGTKKRLRKNGFDTLEGQLIEGMSKEELWEKAGIEDDN